MSAMTMATAERTDLADYLTTLAPDQWDQPSLCRAWRVRDVVAHMISYDGLSTPILISWLLRGRLNISRINAIGVAEATSLTPAQLLDRLHAHLTPTGLSTGFKGGIALVDGMIHHQDIRRALHHPRTIPAERLTFTLDFALRAPTLPARKLARNLRLVASDLDWTSGDGPEVRGSGEALLMAVAGRHGIVDELTGPGQPQLQQRIDATKD